MYTYREFSMKYRPTGNRPKLNWCCCASHEH